MITTRSNAVVEATTRERVDLNLNGSRISDFFGDLVFNEEAMQKYLPEDSYNALIAHIENGTKIDLATADHVAAGMKAWALANGATHFTHWFQPLTGGTAEKHDTFFSPTTKGKGIEGLSGKALVQQEPDASSFPNGGLRATFEARGYTGWDPSSPAFIMDTGAGKTMCIPTVFIAYTGESLDFKTPLLKSRTVLEKAAMDVCHYFDKKVKRVYPTLGWEQEYFLVDAALYNSRPDLVMAGRTLVGHSSAKGQQLDDHYFGSIPERVYAYMRDMETACYKLGIPIKTRHNEVAPGQYECAPVYEELNLAVDHNQLLMDLMDRVARRHNLRVLFHEKPFAGLNGSGKHNNWSLATDTGVNLLSPGKTPKTNLQFLSFFVTTIRAVAEHDDLLRASIASAGNDHRLGANEAPPAIISVFIGSALTKVLNSIKKKVNKDSLDEMDQMNLKLDIHNELPDLLLDNTDRNRTSPFAFTGNKFEIRAVGSAQNCASPMTVMNTIVANQLIHFKNEVDKLIAKGEKKDGAILRVLRKYITESSNILFEGDNYSDDWEKEAAKRGLSNVKTTPKALDFMIDPKAEKLMVGLGIYNKPELHARHEILLENYILKVQIEGRVLGELAMSHIIPAALKYQSQLLENAEAQKGLGIAKSAYQTQLDLIAEIGEHVNEAKKLTDKMTAERKKANNLNGSAKMANAYCDKVFPHYEKIRYHLDKLETLVDNSLWPLPKYSELLFMK